MKLVVRVKLLPTPLQAAAREATLRACNEAATWAAQVAFETQARFACRSCGFVEHADHNSSHNIRQRGWMAWVCGAQSTAPALTLTA